MPSPIATSLVNIIPVVKAQLVRATGLPDTAIRLVARGQTPRFQADQDILIRPGQVAWDQGFDVGSGRVCAIIRRPLLVTVRTRYNVDLSDEDAYRLTDAVNGHIPLEEKVVDALLDFVPRDGNDNMLVQEPMHPLDYPQEEEQPAEAADWVESRLAFQLTYQIPLNQDPSYG